MAMKRAHEADDKRKREQTKKAKKQTPIAQTNINGDEGIEVEEPNCQDTDDHVDEGNSGESRNNCSSSEEEEGDNAGGVKDGSSSSSQESSTGGDDKDSTEDEDGSKDRDRSKSPGRAQNHRPGTRSREKLNGGAKQLNATATPSRKRKANNEMSESFGHTHHLHPEDPSTAVVTASSKTASPNSCTPTSRSMDTHSSSGERSEGDHCHTPYNSAIIYYIKQAATCVQSDATHAHSAATLDNKAAANSSSSTFATPVPLPVQHAPRYIMPAATSNAICELQEFLGEIEASHLFDFFVAVGVTDLQKLESLATFSPDEWQYLVHECKTISPYDRVVLVHRLKRRRLRV
ncbi:uncharacterized protein PHACADRAFT_203110 [Phanerochaete carnosa HHB-10118-sp]|uniref:Uncharacterized protein n=1 Tax=Phanerochaete carnosa (strain HHB-10118-sp) TaxID=650164 RepID=K5VND4_PHACS|nr:uncharacterized protein PHACADRAFT_203110 [Phanerochaete carnosa HHB-10118-sp]EKM48205.1 hypothetical protein PHACADRAFT_203110 [Phanerochaete carnosa HHB-10118-sp]